MSLKNTLPEKDRVCVLEEGAGHGLPRGSVLAEESLRFIIHTFQ